ncbi:translation initiation factor IF-2-like isoform X2 [Fukomys damarensis]|uniref:translation initiation factor IF-2-like isoform X1 n=1 Tax=Fukomys damarensis TaxID=885580 RepID=UPI00053FF5E8|nr:translation initiation factor IF-2-like isoform X1 [Fukomys damarensis]XP_010604764.1 translation initiation factor IF-2-like isoform X2 [Fukomys damarensis]
MGSDARAVGGAVAPGPGSPSADRMTAYLPRSWCFESSPGSTPRPSPRKVSPQRFLLQPLSLGCHPRRQPPTRPLRDHIPEGRALIHRLTPSCLGSTLAPGPESGRSVGRTPRPGDPSGPGSEAIPRAGVQRRPRLRVRAGPGDRRTGGPATSPSSGARGSGPPPPLDTTTSRSSGAGSGFCSLPQRPAEGAAAGRLDPRTARRGGAVACGGCGGQDLVALREDVSP